MTIEPLYKRLLGERYQTLPPTVQALHDVQGSVTWRGRFIAIRGQHPLSRLIASLLSLPKAGDDLPLSVTFTQDGEKEHWERDFDGHRFSSLQWTQNGKLYEKLRLVTLIFIIEANAQELRLQLEDVRLFGLSVKGLRPQVSAVESERDGIFHVDVEVRLPLLGLLVEYHCWLEREETRTS